MQLLISNATEHKQQMQMKNHIPIGEARESRGRLAAARQVKAWGVQESNLPSQTVHWLGTRLTLLTVLVSIQQLAEAQTPPLFTSAPTFFATNHYVAVSVFHWFTATGGQLSGPWRPLEGRSNWTGEPDWWEGQIKQMMRANIDVLYVHLFPGSEQQRVNLFSALSHLRAKGYDTPKVAPFLDPMITWYQQPPVDLATAAGKDTFVGQYIRFYNQYYSVNTDAYADDYLARQANKPVLDTWHVQFNCTNLTFLTRADVSNRLVAAFGAAHPYFTNGFVQVTTALNPPTLSFADEQVPQFEVTQYYYPVTYKAITSVQLKGGYWDQNIRQPGAFLVRAGGVNYRNAWQQVNRATTRRVYLESWNEYDEGTGMFAGTNLPPYIAPANTSGNTDVWSGTGDPFEYIKTTALGATDFNDAPWQSAKILRHNIPASLTPGETRTVTVIVRNTGNASWTAGANYKLGQMDTDTTSFVTGRRVLLNDTQDEIPLYGGIFRGRPKTFQFTLTAPTVPGSYLTHWGVLQEGVGGFGEQLAIPITVKLKTTATVTLSNLLQVYDGTARNVSATTTPAGLTVNLSFNGSVDAPTDAGIYTVIGIINDPNYQGSATNTLFIMANLQLLANGSFEAQPALTTKSISSSAGGAVDTTTFTGWRVFSVGSPSVSNVTATIITNATDGHLAMRLSLTNTGGGTGLDHGLDNDNSRVPVGFGSHYNISFDAAFISGASNLLLTVAEYDTNTVFNSKQIGIKFVVSNTNYQRYSLTHWTPLTNTTAWATVAFRQSSSGTITYSVMSFDNVRFTAAETIQATAIAVTGTTATLSFAGTPGCAYVLQCSTNLLSWVNIATNLAPANGRFSMTDDVSGRMSVPQVLFYRLWQPL
jgi:hypothetical protein